MKRGYSLIEVLVAMGILTIGLVTVVAIFPTAILLQKEAVEDARRQINVRSAESILQGKTIDARTLFKFTEEGTAAGMPAAAGRPGVRDIEFDVFALSEVDRDEDYTGIALNNPDATLPRPDMVVNSYGGVSTYTAASSYLSNWPEEDRSFPSIIPPDPATRKLDKREIYTVPLFRRGPEGTPYIPDWPVYLFVMERDHDSTGQGLYVSNPSDPTGNLTVCANPFDDADYFPKVFRMEVDSVSGNRLDVGTNGNAQVFLDGNGLRVRVGDMIVADDGNIYRVTNADARFIWVNQDLRQDTEFYLDSGKSIKAIWFAMPPTNRAGSPVRDIRLLSGSTVKVITGLN